MYILCLQYANLCQIVNFTWLYARALLKTDVLVPNNPTPRVSRIILLLLLITPSVS